MTHAYAPQPGTISARAIAHMQTLPPGTEITTAVLSEALGQPPASVHPSLNVPLKHGLLTSEKRNGQIFWKLTEGATLAAAGDDVDDDPPIQRVVKAQQGGIALPDVPRWPGLEQLREPGANLPPPDPDAVEHPRLSRAKTARTPVVTVSPYERTTGPRPLRVALWSDGQLQIQRGDFELILLAPEETRQLVKYLERMAEASE